MKHNSFHYRITKIFIVLIIPVLLSCNKTEKNKTDISKQLVYRYRFDNKAFVEFKQNEFIWGTDSVLYKSHYACSKYHESLHPSSHEQGYKLRLSKDYIVVDYLDRCSDINHSSEALKNIGSAKAFLSLRDGKINFFGKILSISYKNQCFIAGRYGLDYNLSSKYPLAISNFNGDFNMIEIEFDKEKPSQIIDISWRDEQAILSYFNEKNEIINAILQIK